MVAKVAGVPREEAPDKATPKATDWPIVVLKVTVMVWLPTVGLAKNHHDIPFHTPSSALALTTFVKLPFKEEETDVGIRRAEEDPPPPTATAMARLVVEFTVIAKV